MLRPKKVGTIPVEGSDTYKQTNEIKIASVLLDLFDSIAGVMVTADALLTQRKFARYLSGRGAYYHFTVKDNQKNLRQDIAAQFESVAMLISPNRRTLRMVGLNPVVSGFLLR